MIITVAEIIKMILMTAAVGFIAMDMFRPAQSRTDPLKNWQDQNNWQRRFLYACAVVAPAIILHEFGHKFTAQAYGLHATFEAAYAWLGLGIFLKLIRFPFLFFVPAYVSIIGSASPLAFSLIAFMGPAVNAAIWLIAMIITKTQKLNDAQYTFWTHTKLINGFLAIFNMIPIPGFDGSKVFAGLAQAFF